MSAEDLFSKGKFWSDVEEEIGSEEDDTPVFHASYFYIYDACPRWLYYELHGDQEERGDLTRLAQDLMERGKLLERQYVDSLENVTRVNTSDIDRAVTTTRQLMERGVDLIYQGALEYEHTEKNSGKTFLMRGRPDLLEKRMIAPDQDITSAFGDYYYVPVEVKSSSEPNEDPRVWMQLGFYSRILVYIQGVFVRNMAAIDRYQLRHEVPFTKKRHKKFRKRASKIGMIIRGRKPPLAVTNTCLESPWGNKILREALDTDDIALIHRVPTQVLENLRDNHVHTIHDAALMSLERLSGQVKGASDRTLERIKLQARALVNDEMMLRRTPEVPTHDLRIFYDIEADPLLDVDYLYGFWIVGDPDGEYAKVGNVRWSEEHPGKYYLYFLAEKPDEEGKMWRQFLAWLEYLPDDYRVYHYHHFEPTRLNKLGMKHGSSDALEQFIQDGLFDLLPVARKCLILPVLSYTLKSIARYRGFEWRHEKAGGAQSVSWYQEWLDSGNRDVLNTVVNYNEDDVIATEFLYNWLVALRLFKEGKLFRGDHVGGPGVCPPAWNVQYQHCPHCYEMRWFELCDTRRAIYRCCACGYKRSFHRTMFPNPQAKSE